MGKKKWPIAKQLRATVWFGFNSLPSFRCGISAILSPGNKKQALCRVLWPDGEAPWNCWVSWEGSVWKIEQHSGNERNWKETKEGERRQLGAVDWTLAALPCSTGSPSVYPACVHTELIWLSTHPDVKEWPLYTVNAILYHIPLSFQVFESDHWASVLIQSLFDSVTLSKAINFPVPNCAFIHKRVIIIPTSQDWCEN